MKEAFFVIWQLGSALFRSSVLGPQNMHALSILGTLVTLRTEVFPLSVQRKKSWRRLKVKRSYISVKMYRNVGN